MSMMGIEGCCPYRYTSLRRETFQQPAVPSLRRPTGHLILLKDGESFYKLSHHPHLPQRPDAFPSQEAISSISLRAPQSPLSTFWV